MGGLRRLLHELTVVGVAAAHYADLQAQQTQHQLEYKDLKKKLAVAEAAQRKALATISQLKPQLIALGGEQSVAAETLAAQLTTAELELKAATLSAETYRSCARLEHRIVSSPPGLRGLPVRSLVVAAFRPEHEQSPATLPTVEPHARHSLNTFLVVNSAAHVSCLSCCACVCARGGVFTVPFAVQRWLIVWLEHGHNGPHAPMHAVAVGDCVTVPFLSPPKMAEPCVLT